MHEWAEDLISWYLRKRQAFSLRSRGTRLGLIIFQSTLSLYWCISNYIYLNRETMPVRPLHISRCNESYFKQTQSCVFNWLNSTGCLEPNSCFINVLTSAYLLRIHDCDVNLAHPVQLSVKWGWRGERCILVFEVSESFYQFFQMFFTPFLGSKGKISPPAYTTKWLAYLWFFRAAFLVKRYYTSFTSKKHIKWYQWGFLNSLIPYGKHSCMVGGKCVVLFYFTLVPFSLPPVPYQ